jgi:hypothetical protein
MTPTNPDPHAHDSYHAQHGHADHDGLYNEDVAHEHSDVNVRSLLMFCLGLAGVVAVAFVAMYGLFIVFDRQADQNDPVLSPLTLPAGELPPEPRLLTDEPGNLLQVKSEEQQILQGYGWVDQKAGTARIPIDEAKKKLLERGLPVRAGTPVDERLGTSLPARGESSSGRIITVKPVQPAATGVSAPEHKAPTPQKSDGH